MTLPVTPATVIEYKFSRECTADPDKSEEITVAGEHIELNCLV